MASLCSRSSPSAQWNLFITGAFSAVIRLRLGYCFLSPNKESIKPFLISSLAGFHSTTFNYSKLQSRERLGVEIFWASTWIGSKKSSLAAPRTAGSSRFLCTGGQLSAEPTAPSTEALLSICLSTVEHKVEEKSEKINETKEICCYRSRRNEMASRSKARRRAVLRAKVKFGSLDRLITSA